jgi:hypothetical protein
MPETSWMLANLDSSRVAVPYQWDDLHSQHVRYPHSGAPYYPSLQLRTSAPQLARFLTAFMQGGALGDARILDPATIEVITSAQCPELIPCQGLLWFYQYVGGRLLWGCYDGSSFGCRTQMFYCPAEGIGAVVMSNGENWYATQVILQELLELAATGDVHDTSDFAPAAAGITLLQNHPNPFNPSTILSYSLPRSGPITLAIYDIFGRHVETLHDGPQRRGEHRAVWKAASASSGVYFARIESEHESRTVRMTLIK